MIWGAESPKQPIVCIGTSLTLPGGTACGDALSAPIRGRLVR